MNPTTPSTPTSRALAKLYADHRPGLRNVCRAWLTLWLRDGRGPRATDVSTVLGFVDKTSYTSLQMGLLVDPYGVIQRSPEARQRSCWRSARLADFISAAELLESLGPMESIHSGRSTVILPVCSECGAKRKESVEACFLCRQLERMPAGWLSRLEYLASRAAAGLPLFDPVPPWAGRKVLL